MAIQFANALGCEVVVFSSTESKREEAMNFGAKEFHVANDSTPFEGVQRLQHLLLCGSAQPDFKKYVSI